MKRLVHVTTFGFLADSWEPGTRKMDRPILPIDYGELYSDGGTIMALSQCGRYLVRSDQVAAGEGEDAEFDVEFLVGQWLRGEFHARRRERRRQIELETARALLATALEATADDDLTR